MAQLLLNYGIRMPAQQSGKFLIAVQNFLSKMAKHA
jgi:hypothetical protein